MTRIHPPRQPTASLSAPERDFVAVASHDLRAPLAAIVASIEIVRNHGDHLDETTRNEMLDLAAAEAAHLAGFIDDLQTVSRVAAGLFSLDVAEVDVASLLRDAAEAAGAAGRTRIDTGEIGPIRGDREILARILTRLIESVCRSSPDAQEIEVSLWSEAVQLVFSVGVRHPEAPRRGPLSALDLREPDIDSRETDFRLLIARNLAEAHGGRVWVPGGPAGGLRFLLTIPARSRPARTPGRRAGSPLVRAEPRTG